MAAEYTPFIVLLHGSGYDLCRTSPYFPRIADLRQLAYQLSCVVNFATMSSPIIDYLDLQACQQYNAFFKTCKLEVQDWHNLIKQFENVDRTCLAKQLRHQ